MNNYEAIIEKVKKCLRLSKSSNEHEAATALAMAQALMGKYHISEGQVLASEASERRSRSGAGMTPPRWESMLFRDICDAFRCRRIYSPATWPERRAEWIFIGCGPEPEIAQYTADVLFRQARRARKIFIDSLSKRIKKSSKVRRADNYCEGWVISATSKLHGLSIPQDQFNAIEAYIEGRYRTIATNAIVRTPESASKMSAKKLADFINGYDAGKKAILNRAAAGNDVLQPRQIVAGGAEC